MRAAPAVNPTDARLQDNARFILAEKAQEEKPMPPALETAAHSCLGARPTSSAPAAGPISQRESRRGA